MPNDIEILRADVETLKKELRDLRNLIPPEVIQTVPKGVNWNLMSANSKDPGHLHTLASGIDDVSLSSVAQGDVLYRGASKWNNLAQSTKGKALTTGGASANPSWEGMTTQGDVEYHNGTTRARLAAGTSGQFLKTQGAGANPTWASVTNPIKLVSSFHTEASVVNTVDETNLMSFTLTGGDLGTAGILWGRIFIQKLDATSGDTLRIRSYYGATAADDTTGIDGTITNMRGFLEFWILGTGATNTQDLDFRLHTFSGEKIDSLGAVDSAVQIGWVGSSGTTAAIDSTANQTVKVTAQWSAARVGNDIRSAYGFAMLLNT